MVKKKFAGQMSDFLGINAENKEQSREPVAAPVTSVVVTEAPKGRPRSEKKVVRPIKKYGRIDVETDKKLKLLFVNQSLETQDIICAALLDFLDKYYKDGYLSDEGKRIVENL